MQRQPRPSCAGAASTSSSPRWAGWPAATRAPAGWPTRRHRRRGHRRARRPWRRASPRRPRDLRGARRAGHRRRHPRADRPGALHRQPLLGQAGPRPRRGGRGPGRRRHPRHDHRPRPCPPGIEGGRGRDGRRDAATPSSPGPPTPTWWSWPPRWPTSGPELAADRKLKKGDGVPEIVLEPTADILAELGAARRPGQMLVGFAAETDRAWRPTRARQADPQARSTCVVANDCRPRASGSSTTPTPCVILGPRRGRDRGRPRPTSGRWPSAVLDAVVAAAHTVAGRQHRAPSDNPARGAARDPLDLHVGVGDRRPPRQDGRPDLRRHPRRHPGQDPIGRVACETLLTTGLVVVAGEITTTAYVEIPSLVRETVCEHRLRPRVVRLRRQHLRCQVTSIDAQSPDIAQGVDTALEIRTGTVGRGHPQQPRAPATRG